METAANSTEKFPEIPETVEFPKCEPFNRKFLKKSESKVEWKEHFREKKVENLGIPPVAVLFFGNLETVVPFTTGSCRKLKPDVLGEWK